MSMSIVGGDLPGLLQANGLSLAYVVDSVAQILVLPEEIDDALDGLVPANLILADNDNSDWPGRPRLIAV